LLGHVPTIEPQGLPSIGKPCLRQRRARSAPAMKNPIRDAFSVQIQQVLIARRAPHAPGAQRPSV
jgi:hypothetical protein